MSGCFGKELFRGAIFKHSFGVFFFLVNRRIFSRSLINLEILKLFSRSLYLERKTRKRTSKRLLSLLLFLLLLHDTYRTVYHFISQIGVLSDSVAFQDAANLAANIQSENLFSVTLCLISTLPSNV